MKHIFLSRFKPKRKARAILFLLVLALTAGMITSCNTDSKQTQTDTGGQTEPANPSETDEPGDSPQKDTDGAQEKPAENTTSETPQEQDAKPEAALAKTVSGEWELFTTDWMDYTPLEPSQTLVYTLDVPEKWVDEGSVFVTEERKVAEVCPPVKLEAGQTLPENFSFLDGGINGSLLSEKDITAGDYTGRLTVFETNPSGGDIDTWYPYTYYLKKGDIVFVMAFYSLDKDNADDAKQYEQILSTLKLK